MSGLSQTQKDALSAKLEAQHVKSRSQAGRNLSYVEAWHVIAEANRIFGFDAWDRQTMEIRQLGEPREVDVENKGRMWRVGYMAKVRIVVTADGGREILRDGCGYGSGIDKDVGQAHESALKEAESDAMKRAFMTFGNPFGLALYDKSQENVERSPPPLPPQRPVPPQSPAPPPQRSTAPPPGEKYPVYDGIGVQVGLHELPSNWMRQVEQMIMDSGGNQKTLIWAKNSTMFGVVQSYVQALPVAQKAKPQRMVNDFRSLLKRTLGNGVLDDSTPLSAA